MHVIAPVHVALDLGSKNPFLSLNKDLFFYHLVLWDADFYYFAANEYGYITKRPAFFVFSSISVSTFFIALFTCQFFGSSFNFRNFQLL